MSDTCKSCVGCKFLYGDGQGYSNYTWMDTIVTCALDKNDLLRNARDEWVGGASKAEQPMDWPPTDPLDDQWPLTMTGRCPSYAPGPYIVLDPDRYCWDGESAEFGDQEQLTAIWSSDGKDGPFPILPAPEVQP